MLPARSMHSRLPRWAQRLTNALIAPARVAHDDDRGFADGGGDVVAWFAEFHREAEVVPGGSLEQALLLAAVLLGVGVKPEGHLADAVRRPGYRGGRGETGLGHGPAPGGALDGSLGWGSGGGKVDPTPVPQSGAGGCVRNCNMEAEMEGHGGAPGVGVVSAQVRGGACGRHGSNSADPRPDFPGTALSRVAHCSCHATELHCRMTASQERRRCLQQPWCKPALTLR